MVLWNEGRLATLPSHHHLQIVSLSAIECFGGEVWAWQAALDLCGLPRCGASDYSLRKTIAVWLVEWCSCLGPVRLGVMWAEPGAHWEPGLVYYVLSATHYTSQLLELHSLGHGPGLQSRPSTIVPPLVRRLISLAPRVRSLRGSANALRALHLCQKWRRRTCLPSPFNKWTDTGNSLLLLHNRKKWYTLKKWIKNKDEQLKYWEARTVSYISYAHIPPCSFCLTALNSYQYVIYCNLTHVQRG